MHFLGRWREDRPSTTIGLADSQTRSVSPANSPASAASKSASSSAKFSSGVGSVKSRKNI